jgi:hypothetical protein
MTRTVYDEVRECAENVATNPTPWAVTHWRAHRDLSEQRIIDNRMSPEPVWKIERDSLVRIAALAIAQIEALDRRSAEGAK